MLTALGQHLTQKANKTQLPVTWPWQQRPSECRLDLGATTSLGAQRTSQPAEPNPKPGTK